MGDGGGQDTTWVTVEELCEQLGIDDPAQANLRGVRVRIRADEAPDPLDLVGYSGPLFYALEDAVEFLSARAEDRMSRPGVCRYCGYTLRFNLKGESRCARCTAARALADLGVPILGDT